MLIAKNVKNVVFVTDKGAKFTMTSPCWGIYDTESDGYVRLSNSKAPYCMTTKKWLEPCIEMGQFDLLKDRVNYVK